MIHLNKLLNKYDFETLYNALLDENFSYTFENIASKFSKCKGTDIYCFLMYVISKKETAEVHLAICKSLIYLEPYIYESYNMVRWHVDRALEVSKNDFSVMSWVIECFYGDPSSPFNNEKMYLFAKEVCRINSSDVIALKIIKDYESQLI